MKAIVLSIRPEHALNILNGVKTLELRKSVPKDFVGWVYGYVTKGGDRLAYEIVDYDSSWGYSTTYGGYSLQNHIDDFDQIQGEILNGTIPFRFWFDGYERYVDYSGCTNNENGYECENEYMYQICELEEERRKTCLTCEQIEQYGNGKDLYAWHISKLEIFDRPMQLSEFTTFKIPNDAIFERDLHGKEYFYKKDRPSYHFYFGRLQRPPQSWQYIWAKE